MKRCNHCQADNQPDATVCATCGRPLPSKGSGPPKLAVMPLGPGAGENARPGVPTERLRPPEPPKPAAPVPASVYPPAASDHPNLAVPTPAPAVARPEPMSPNSEVPVAAPAHPPLATAPASFPETPPAGIRHVVRLCFVTSLISFLVAVGSSQYRHQLTVLGERMGGVNGPFLICLALITLLAGMGLRKRWSGGWNLAVLAGVIGVIAGVVRISHGGPGTIVAVPLIGLCLAVIGYLLRGPVIIWFRGGPKFTTTSYRRVRGDPFEDLFPAFQDRYEVKREHDLLNYAGGLLVVAYGFVYFISLLGPAREFTSREHRFTISAPPGWVVADVPQTGAVVSLVRPVGKGYFRDQPCVSIYIQPSNAAAEDLSPEEIRAWEQDWVQRASAFVSPTPESMSVAGILGWKITLEHPRGGRSSERWLLAVVKREDRAFTLRCATEASIFEDTLAACASVFEQFQFLP